MTDYTLLLNAIVKNPGAYEIAGDVFGPEDNYGIGLPLDSDGVIFVNDFLKKIEEDGTWAICGRSALATAPVLRLYRTLRLSKNNRLTNSKITVRAFGISPGSSFS